MDVSTTAKRTRAEQCQRNAQAKSEQKRRAALEALTLLHRERWNACMHLYNWWMDAKKTMVLAGSWGTIVDMTCSVMGEEYRASPPFLDVFLRME